MKTRSSPRASKVEPRAKTIRLAAVVIVVVVAAAYANSLRVPFVFDDVESIAHNASIRSLSWSAWMPPGGTTVSGRPIVNISLAINHALGGESVFGYHLANVGIHALAALVLFGLLRRTFDLSGSNGLPREQRLDAKNTWLAFGAAMIWALHPLQTESVTYVVQRAESLMGLFYLLTLYCFVRAVHSPRRRAWETACVVACLLGVATKEVMVSAPLIVLLYDRVFVAGSFANAWRQRRKMYVALAGTWLLLALLLWHSGNRAGTAGISTGISSWEYALTQSRAIAHYLRAAAWPHPLVFDHGEFTFPGLRETLPYAFAIVALLAATAFAWKRMPAAGFACITFFAVLAPTSSIVPILTEPVAEHRMYLPLAALVALVAAGLRALGPRRAASLMTIVALGCGFLTVRRNDAYRSERTLWAATVEAAPTNARAHASLAWALRADGERAAAEAHFKTAIALRPDAINAREGLGSLLADNGRLPEAIAQYEVILLQKPQSFFALHALGVASAEQGVLANAVHYFEDALRVEPNSAPAHNNLGCVFFQLGDFAAAIMQHQAALRIKPDYAEANYNLGNALARQNQLQQARDEYLQALHLKPDYAEAHINLASVFQNLGQRDAAIEHYRNALRLRPNDAFSRKNLEALLAAPPR